MRRESELRERIRDFFRFERQELNFLIPAILIVAFSFSYNDWGEAELDLAEGLKNFLLLIIIAALSFFARISCQKIYALKEGYKAEFKGWWLGIIIAFLITILSNGSIPLILIGGITASLMVRQRLGEFRYGFSYLDNAKISLSGIVANILLSLFFGLGLYFFPDNYFFLNGMFLNLMMAACSSFPLPQLEGLNIYFGSRTLYLATIIGVVLFGILLWTQIQIGLILAIVVMAIITIIQLLMGTGINR